MYTAVNIFSVNEVGGGCGRIYRSCSITKCGVVQHGGISKQHALHSTLTLFVCLIHPEDDNCNVSQSGKWNNFNPMVQLKPKSQNYKLDRCKNVSITACLMWLTLKKTCSFGTSLWHFFIVINLLSHLVYSIYVEVTNISYFSINLTCYKHNISKAVWCHCRGSCHFPSLGINYMAHCSTNTSSGLVDH